MVIKKAFFFLFCFLTLLALLYGHPTENRSARDRSFDGGVQKYLFPLLGDWIKGPVRAPVFLIEYVDFQCPVCKRYNETVNKLLKDYQGNLSVIYRHKPSQTHPYAFIAALCAESAGLEGRFWPMVDLLFENQERWAGVADPIKLFKEYAMALNIPEEKFMQNLRKPELRDKILKDLQSSFILGMTQVPSFILGGERIPNPQSYEDFKILVEAALIKSKKRELVHEHADFRVVLDGKPIDFSAPKYQSRFGQEIDPYVHLHHGNGRVIHKHKRGITLGYFFKTLGMELSKDRFVLDTGEKFEVRNGKVLLLFVNGKLEPSLDAYEPRDLDRILIYYGPFVDKLIAKEISSVSDEACIYSLKCPQRGKPPDEECVGQLGSDCQ
ncbi:DsbA family protein [Candidatus Methylacidiphilum infernorum]|uniref:DsbA family protein n=1 Tax=Candidatus Methylacidiphilum infernorum TaxID=511746 RepID=A0ABX7PWX3_9BACT|nr:thioredoxin domain-containing protein [Candidatus Methylacidiphilum infernorum]QSR87173.1 DsbA family protein [Candidatus Methylacidiphilum infernorum]